MPKRAHHHIGIEHMIPIGLEKLLEVERATVETGS
jgi:hypothetical protein